MDPQPPTFVALTAGGPRVTVTQNEAYAMDARFRQEAEGNTVNKVDLSVRQWTLESLSVLAPYLTSLSNSVRIVNLSDVIAGLEVNEGLSVWQLLAETFESSNLTEIDLSSNAIGVLGLPLLTGLFGNSDVQILCLSDCGLDDICLGHLLNCFDERICTSLMELNLNRNAADDNGAVLVGEFLPRLERLVKFLYLGCRPRRVGTRALCLGLDELTERSPGVLRTIVLADLCLCIGLDDDSSPIASLCNAIARCSQLLHLNIDDGNLGLDGMTQLVAALTASGAHLEHLSLGYNDAELEGATVLREYLHGHSASLIYLNLNGNDLGDDGVLEILEAFAASPEVLESLHLDDNEIEGDGAEALVETNFTNLQVLSVKGNPDIVREQLESRYTSVDFGSDTEEENDDGDDFAQVDLWGSTE